MECPRCRASNRTDRRFCGKCGAPLARPCPACGTPSEDGDTYCGGCGQSLESGEGIRAHAPPGSDAERRQLTVMFCDLVGSTALSHHLDPEDLRVVIRRYQALARDAITRYQGFVARYMGDGILAYFGYPHAHEDDAARAIHAGLELIEALADAGARIECGAASRPGVRIGIATGLVVVGDLIGEGASEEIVAMGDTPNLAARIQALAEPGAVLVAQGTLELTAGVFEFADHGAHDLKGLDEPVRLWRVVRPSQLESRFDAARARRFAPLVGRDKEIDLLLALWQRAKKGIGQFVLLSGEAGIGKSRIAESLGERIADEARVRLIYQCSPYHANSALYPVIQHLERAAGLRRTDTSAQRLERLEALLAKSTPCVAEIAPLFASLLSLPTDGRYPPLKLSPQEQKDKTLAALVAWIGELSREGPIQILFEDVHWVDPTSAEFLGLLAQRGNSLPLLAVITSREHADPARLGAWVSLPHVTSLDIERLDRRESAIMVDRLIERAPLPPELVDQIVTRTDGVPLFIEELTRTLVASSSARDGGAATNALRWPIPATLQDSLMARLDRLGPAKAVAQTGAVIGREFSYELVAAISPSSDAQVGEALRTLVSSGLAFAHGQPPGATYMFKHALVQDAAYSSLLRSRRIELHSRVAETLERAYPERVRVEPELLAHHYSHAGQAMRAAGYWALAAQRALERSANLEALGHANAGLERLATVDPSPERDRLELNLEILRGTAHRAVSGFASSMVEGSFSRARDLCERVGDLPRLIDARRGLFSCYYARGALSLAREEGEQVARLGQRVEDRGSRMLGHWMSGCVMFWQGEFPAARRELEIASSLYDADEARGKMLALQIDPGVNAMLHLSWLLWILGYPDQAVRTSEKAISMARDLSQPFALAMALIFACATRICCRQHALAASLADEVTELTAAHGLGYIKSVARVLKGQALIERGEHLAGVQHIAQAFSEFKAQEAGVGLPWAMHFAATGYARLGKIDEALATLGAALTAAERNGEHQWDAELWRLKGETILLAPARDMGEAETCLRRALDIARLQSALSLELRAATSLARMLAARDKSGDARRVLEECRGRFTEGFDTGDLREAGAMLDSFRAVS